MCGIAGYFGKGNENILNSMMNRIQYRGPNKKYLYTDSEVGVGNNRLSIIDKNDYDKIIQNEEGSIILAFNGEIYNYQEIKRNLKKHKFKTRTDSEVIVHLYEEVGLKIFDIIEGMFALAIYDKKNGSITLGRDRTGEKPLYWGVFKRTLLFGSEIKAIAAHPNFKKEIDLKALKQYLFDGYINAPLTIFNNLNKLEPGHFLVYNHKKIKKKQYWDYDFTKSIEEEHTQSTVNKFDEFLQKTVTSRMDPDKEIGIFLSGGLDSSTLAYYASRQKPLKVNTFSVGFKNTSFDETKFSRKVAHYLGVKAHKEINISSRKALGSIEDIYGNLDEPLADMALIPNYLIAKEAKNYVDVCLSGEGMDELMCGYDTFLAEKIVTAYIKVPKFIRTKIIEKIIKEMPSSQNYIPLDFKLKKFIEGVDQDLVNRHHYWIGAFTPPKQKKLISSWLQKEIEKNQNTDDEILSQNIRKNNSMDALIYNYLKTYLADNILTKSDRASMYNSLEVRSPFLNRELIDFINSLPQNLKLKNFRSKYLLKQTMKGKLPKEIIKRPKKGFGVPISSWICDDFKPLILDSLSYRKMKEHDFFDHNHVNHILDQHFQGKENNYKLIWTLFVFQYWYENWYKKL